MSRDRRRPRGLQEAAAEAPATISLEQILSISSEKAGNGGDGNASTEEAAEGGAPAEETKDGGEEPPVLKFRNYLPKDEVLGEAVMKATKAPEFEPVEAKPLAVAEEVS